KKADRMFYYACLSGGCPIPQARVLYLGVRIGSWSAQKVSFWSKLIPKNLLFRLPSTPKMQEEILMRDLFAEGFREIAKMDESENFESLEALVDKVLK
ncbi:MAG TPA: hypothetical protein VLS45_00790, partial [Methylomicrobium sp.]|nr:hypothetical protein [Methylomicrobium sp.]